MASVGFEARCRGAWGFENVSLSGFLCPYKPFPMVSSQGMPRRSIPYLSQALDVAAGDSASDGPKVDAAGVVV